MPDNPNRSHPAGISRRYALRGVFLGALGLAVATGRSEAKEPLRPAKAAEDVRAWLNADSHRVLLHHGQPVGMTGFNVRLPGIVQIGGVYTPPDLRNRGYARTAVALHLAEVRTKGTTRAVLFAATPAAARAYRAIGFQPNGSFALVLFTAPATIAA